MSSYYATTVTGRREFAGAGRLRSSPAPGEVRIGVQACGVCHADVLAVEGLRPDPSRPLVPGHEVIGVIEAGGDGVPDTWRIGDRVGAGFLGGPDDSCEFCRRGDFVDRTGRPWTGTHMNGGYAQVACARATVLDSRD